MEAFLAGLFTVGLAELGDKTQLLVFLLARHFRRPIVVALAMTLAFLISFSIAAWVGGWISGFFEPVWIELAAGLLFIAIGIWMLRGSDDDLPVLKVAPRSLVSVFCWSFSIVLLAEMGDKSQLTGMALAMQLSPIWLIITGALIGTMVVNLPLIWLADRPQLSERINHKLQGWMRYVGSFVFIAVGLFIFYRQFFSG